LTFASLPGVAQRVAGTPGNPAAMAARGSWPAGQLQVDADCPTPTSSGVNSLSSCHLKVKEKATVPVDGRPPEEETECPPSWTDG